jgi:hypothetical protein
MIFEDIFVQFIFEDIVIEKLFTIFFASPDKKHIVVKIVAKNIWFATRRVRLLKILASCLALLLNLFQRQL